MELDNCHINCFQSR